MKSISRGMTFKRDLIAPDEMEQAVAALAGAVAEQLRREKHLHAAGVGNPRPDFDPEKLACK